MPVLSVCLSVWLYVFLVFLVGPDAVRNPAGRAAQGSVQPVLLPVRRQAARHPLQRSLPVAARRGALPQQALGPAAQPVGAAAATPHQPPVVEQDMGLVDLAAQGEEEGAFQALRPIRSARREQESAASTVGHGLVSLADRQEAGPALQPAGDAKPPMFSNMSIPPAQLEGPKWPLHPPAAQAQDSQEPVLEVVEYENHSQNKI